MGAFTETCEKQQSFSFVGHKQHLKLDQGEAGSLCTSFKMCEIQFDQQTPYNFWATIF